MSDTEVDDDFDASFEVDNPDVTQDISLNDTVRTEESAEGSLDLESASFSSQLTSTPNKQKAIRSQVKNVLFKLLKAPKDIVSRCPECAKGLKTKDGLNNHILAHKWKRLAVQRPNPLETEQYCLLQCRQSVLQSLASDPAGGKYGPDYNFFVKTLLMKTDCAAWEEFCRKVCCNISQLVGCDVMKKGQRKQQTGKSFSSALRAQVQQGIFQILSVQEERDNLVDALFKVQIVVTEVAYPFLMTFMQKVGSSALIHQFRTMMGVTDSAEERMNRSKDDFNAEKSHKLVHYISGACMRSHVRHACRHPRNKRLQVIKEVILNKFTQAPPTVVDKKDKANWTKTLSQKSLFFVNDNAFNFFLELAKLLQQMELKEGSIGHEAVMDRVVEVPRILFFFWDMIVGASLDDDESFSFMVKVIRTITNSYGVGVLLRRMNQQWRKGKGNKASMSVSHRATLI